MTFIITQELLKNAPNIKVINRSMRALRQFNINTEQSFMPTPNHVTDSRGNKVTSGVVDFVYNDSGEIAKIIFINPKDSAYEYARQSFAISDNLLILPCKNEDDIVEINTLIDTVVHHREMITIAEFDQVLKGLYNYYIGKHEIPDIYNSNIDQLSDKKHIKIGNHAYQKVSAPENLYFIEIPYRETVGFRGTVSDEGHILDAQYSTGSFVVITGIDSENGKHYARKLDLDYAKHNLCDAEIGKPIDFDMMQKAQLKEIMKSHSIIAQRAELNKQCASR